MGWCRWGFTKPMRRLDTSVWSMKIKRYLGNSKMSLLKYHLNSTQRLTSCISVNSLNSQYEEQAVHIPYGNKNYLIDKISTQAHVSKRTLAHIIP